LVSLDILTGKLTISTATATALFIIIAAIRILKDEIFHGCHLLSTKLMNLRYRHLLV